MANSKNEKRQSLTISLSRRTLQQARILAAQRQTSIRGLLTEAIEALVGKQQAYKRAKRQAIALLNQGFHLGAVVSASRDQLHER